MRHDVDFFFRQHFLDRGLNACDVHVDLDVALEQDVALSAFEYDGGRTDLTRQHVNMRACAVLRQDHVGNVGIGDDDVAHRTGQSHGRDFVQRDADHVLVRSQHPLGFGRGGGNG